MPLTSPIPVFADLLPRIGGSAVSNAQIGRIEVRLDEGSDMLARFLFTGNYSQLDNCYDFRWIHIASGEQASGVIATHSTTAGLLPGIDPAPAQIAPMQIPGGVGDSLPLYYNEDNWTSNAPFGIRHEGLRSVFLSDVHAPSVGARYTWETYLVARHVAPTSTPQELVVLEGLTWRYDGGDRERHVLWRDRSRCSARHKPRCRTGSSLAKLVPRDSPDGASRVERSTPVTRFSDLRFRSRSARAGLRTWRSTLAARRGGILVLGLRELVGHGARDARRGFPSAPRTGHVFRADAGQAAARHLRLLSRLSRRPGTCGRRVGVTRRSRTRA